MAALLACCLALLFHLPASAPTTLDNLSLLSRANGTSPPSVVQEKAAASPSPPPSVQPEAATPSPSGQEEGEKKKKEKQELEEIAKLKQEAQAKGLVSFTNGTGSYKGMPREFVAGHNMVRERYGVPPVKWNNKLARNARRWSNAMRKDCQIMHSPGQYGECVFASAMTNGWNATAKDALSDWTKEEAIYDKLTGNCTVGRHFTECGHFRLMVTPKFQKIGCSRAECYRGGVFITCNYYFGDLDP